MKAKIPGFERDAGFLFVMEGEAARIAGEPATSNPYEPGSLHGCKWMEGWNEGV
jgi:hypothetical protein